ncbi:MULTISPECIES: peptidase inhibitor family I36 protein [Streptomyces]|uniref:Peptidase inhibitor family I36 protein n=1 Tax=Streptomyces lycii TaxID=2654337 RepID=A0ABQ7FD09_9ACTN|nr:MULTISPECIES: peptidase inhibitor family I36 protein [Streptomyces]KAF4406259.1 peptidase inhibitor family I36 protein [Streptomyces lycii]PGH48822.1 hypothetical protein CRI70_20925 [Streptomyces sp. Ru87]
MPSTPSRLRLAAAAAAALAATAFLPGTAAAAEPPNETKRGAGLTACPVDATCLYEFERFNLDEPRGGAIWAYYGSVFEIDWTANDKAQSVFNNTNNAVHLYDNGNFGGRCADLQAYSSEPRLTELVLNKRISSIATREQLACAPSRQT